MLQKFDRATDKAWCSKKKNIYGIDIRANRVIAAKKLFPDVNFLNMNASSLKFPDKYFNFITASTLFSSILDRDMRIKIATEIAGVLIPNGYILFYDFRYNNPKNDNVIGITKVK